MRHGTPAETCLDVESAALPAMGRSGADRVHQALLSTVDGQRNVIELESVAKAMGLPDWTLADLRAQGLVKWETSAERPS
jgi:hypothetical protein